MSDWLDDAVARLGDLATHEERLRALFAAVGNEIHHGTGVANPRHVTRELEEEAEKISAALLAGVKPAEVRVAAAKRD